MKRCPISLVTRETKIKATVKYHTAPTRMAIIIMKMKNEKITVLVRRWRNRNPQTLLVEM